MEPTREIAATRPLRCGGKRIRDHGDLVSHTSPAQADGTTSGIRYHQFSRIDDLPAFYEDYVRAIDAVGAACSAEQRSEMFDEARRAFELNISLNESVMADHSAAL